MIWNTTVFPVIDEIIKIWQHQIHRDTEPRQLHLLAQVILVRTYLGTASQCLFSANIYFTCSSIFFIHAYSSTGPLELNITNQF